MLRLLVALGLALSLSAAPEAQVGFSATNGRNHPELHWVVARTAHFEIVYPDRLAGIEAEVAPVAEATLAAVAANLGGRSPITFDDPVRIYLSDEDEIANGSAYNVGSSGFTTIWVNVNDAADVFSGDAQWLRKVVAHELTHLIHYRAVQSNLGLLSAFFADPLPRAWTEGLAQYETERWDAQRGDRWLRTAVFEDRLGYEDGQSAWNGRLLYSVGNSQVRHLAEQRGDSTIARILAHREPVLFGLGRVNDFQHAFRAVTGEPFSTFQEEWRQHVNVYYNTIAGQMERLDSLGVEPLALPGQVIYDVAFSPDTMQVAVVALPSLARPVRRLYVTANPGRRRAARQDSAAVADSLGAVNAEPPDETSARATDVPVPRGLRILAEGTIEGAISWSPDGSRIAYSRLHRGAHGSLVNDLYTVDVASGRKRRLTTSRRATSPTFAPDGRRLAFVGAATADGASSATSNLFVLDTETGAETPLTRFTGTVQITSARWSPDGRHIAVALFDTRRDLALIDAATGALTRLGTDAGGPEALRDDRLPVWSPDGRTLAYTSLRDGAPNVFYVGEQASSPDSVLATTSPLPPGEGQGEGDALARDSMEAIVVEQTALVGEIPTRYVFGDGHHIQPRETRVTYLFDGAEVRGWLPPNAEHPAGRLVLLASETKRRDRMFVVDAARRPTVAVDTLVVPDAYARWTAQRPPREVPTDIAPDASLVTERYPYRSFRHLTHAITLPLPYADPANNDYGVFANSLWLEPLGKHALVLLAGVSVSQPVEKSFLLLEYVNRQFAPTLTLDLYRFPSPSSFYGNSVLVEDLTGGDVSATLPLDVIDRPFTDVLAGLRLRYAYADPLNLDDFTDLDAVGDSLLSPEAGTRADLQLGLAYKFQRPYRYNVIAPFDGTGARLRSTFGAPVLGADTWFARPDLLAYATSPAVPFLGGTRVFVQGRATAVFGEQLAQDYVGLARYDDVDVQLPFVGAVTLDDAERVRGYRRYAVGTRALFGSVEVRGPVVADLQTTLLGLVRLGAVAPAVFADGGLVWSGSNLDGAVRRLGVGAELRNVVSVVGFEVLHSVGLATPAGNLDEVFDGSIAWDDVDLYYRIQAAVPF
jgi:Tol biopolymer transport system component